MGEWTELPGATQPLPNQAARITAAVEGRVAWLLHDPNVKDGPSLAEGQRVEKGQIIGKLDDRIVRANRDKLQASLDEFKEQKKQAGLAVEKAQVEVKRLESLNAMSGTGGPLANPIELANARIALKVTQSQREGVALKQKSSEEELRGLNTQLDYYVLKAPIAGRLGAIQAVPGQTLAIGAVVAEVLDLDDIDVLCYVPPHTAGRLALGQKARIVSDQQDNSAQRGTITFIAVQAQPDTGSFAVKVRFPNRERQLRSGAVLRIEVLTKPEEPRVTIDENALLEDSDPPSVVIVRDLHEEKNPETGVIDEVGVARKLRAIIGVRDRRWKRVEILKIEDLESKEEVPLTDDVRFVVKGAAGLEGDNKEGDKVKLEKDED